MESFAPPENASTSILSGKHAFAGPFKPIATNQRHHRETGLKGSLGIIGGYLYEILSNLPALLELRRFYQSRPSLKEQGRDPVVAMIGDNLDEINGIANSSRIMVKKMRKRGHKMFLIGVAFHGHPARVETKDGSVIMVPGHCSMNEPGYPGSEIAVPKLKWVLRFLRRHPVDLFEFETPSAVPFTALTIAKIIGIKTCSHYRTDILTYSRMLIPSRLGVWGINTWTTLFTRFAGPVIVPSQAFKPMVEAMGVPPDRIHKLTRGVDLDDFHPDKADNHAWDLLGLPIDGPRLLYVGRVSREKNLQVLIDTFPRLVALTPGLNLTVVGDGPFLAEMKAKLSESGRVQFTGVLKGENLSGIFAAADIFVFPSTTDTFGNSVIEALASGLPCITSNAGGPQEIIVDGECGFVFDSGNPSSLVEKVDRLVRSPELLARFKANARLRALQFTYENSAREFWDFYCRLARQD